MGEPDAGDHVLALICRKGVYEILRLFDRPAGAGGVTFGQIARLQTPGVSSLLRSLAPGAQRKRCRPSDIIVAPFATTILKGDARIVRKSQ
jgi:hypothetical protein